ncbi:MAG: xanthine dehydrogenase family protein molybdopterin-binding subunit [Pseudomonadota bacterium]
MRSEFDTAGNDAGHGVGQPVVRKEDLPFLTGQATFTDDLEAPDALHLVVVRAPVAHARLNAVNADAARSVAGVRGVFSAADLRAAGIGVIPALTRAAPFAFNDRSGAQLPDPAQFALAEDRIRYVGEPVAFVVADTRAAARDAADLVELDYLELPVAVAYRDAVNSDSMPLWPEHGRNVSFEWDLGDRAASDAAFARADHAIELELVNNRVCIAFMEPRSATASWDGRRYTLTTGSQGAPGLKAHLLTVFGIAAPDIRVITPATGGGFGARGGVYPEFVMTLYAARKLGQPVRWAAERSESFLADCQSRDHQFKAALAFDADGTFKALRVHADWRHGAYLTSRSAWVMTQYLPPTVGGVYRTGPLDLTLRGLFSNTAPQSAYRGVGRVEATYIIESLVDAAARHLSVDPATLRERNLVPPTAMPWRAAGGAEYPSGDFPANLERALELADHAGLARRREAAAGRGALFGFGIAMFIENDGGAPIEFATVRARRDGDVELLAGTQDFGMGHQTVYSQVLCDQLGIDFDNVHVYEGDTDLIPEGSGSHGSRSGRVGGGAIVKSADAFIERGRELAADLLEAAIGDIDYVRQDQRFTIRGTDRSADIADLAAAAQDRGQTFEGKAQFLTERPAFSNGAQVAEVEIDPDTGHITLVKHIIVMDAGRVLNPLIVDGQMHGGLAQGLGQAWLEDTVYDDQTGQLLSGSFMDYTLPRAADLPDFDIAYNEIAEADNPLGVKGAGEGPTSGSPAAFMNAVRDAIAHAGGNPSELHMPATPERVWRALQTG